MRTVDYIRPKLYPKQEASVFHKKRIGLVEASTKAGKAQPIDCKISTPNGWIDIGSLKVGNIIHGTKGNTKVTGIYPQGKMRSYLIKFSDGSSTRASEGHLWAVSNSRGKYRVFTTKQLIERPHWDFKRMYVPQHQAVEYDCNKDIILDPYLLGYLTGDGCFTGCALAVAIDPNEIECVEKIRNKVEQYKHSLQYNENSDWYIRKPSEKNRSDIITALRKCGLWGLYSHEKFAPDYIKYGSIETRIAYLQGIFDSDGYVNKHGQPSIEQTSKQLSFDITHIVRSLGGVVKCSEKNNSYKGKCGNRIQGKRVYRQYIAINNPSSIFSMSRKVEKCRSLKKPVKKTFKSIEYIGLQDCQCIEVDSPDRLYLTDDFIATHNTHSHLVWLLEQAVLGRENENYWWVAPVYSQAEIAYTRMKAAIPRELVNCNETKLKQTLANGAHLWFKSAEKPDNLYGDDVKAAVMDEASRAREQSYNAIYTTLTATRGKLRLIGNVKGRKNFFYHLCRRAESGDPDMHYTKLTAYDAVEAGILDADIVESARRDLPEMVFRELYLAEPADDGGNPFGLADIRACVAPLSQKPVVAWGIDLAKSYDWTVAIGLDDDGVAAKIERWQSPWMETLARIKMLVGNTPALVDSTGVGDAILEDLQRGSVGNYEGYKFTQSSKQQLMEGLAVAIQNRRVRYPDGHIVSELESFEYEYTRTGVRYSAPQGLHDDCVCALALAVTKIAQPRPEIRIRRL